MTLQPMGRRNIWLPSGSLFRRALRGLRRRRGLGRLFVRAYDIGEVNLSDISLAPSPDLV